MLDFIRSILTPRETLPPHIHFHTADDGRRVFCDESACRPRQEQPLLNAALWSHTR